jgi:hypothetical protein
MGSRRIKTASPSLSVEFHREKRLTRADSATIDYFALLNIDIGPASFSSVTVVHSDFQTGDVVDVQTSSNYSAYEAQLAKYSYLTNSWDLPSPAPADLLLSFGDFVDKYDLGDEAYNIFNDGAGFANILDQLTVNVMKLVDDTYFNSIAGGAVMPVSGKADEIYTVALERLGSDALLSSNVTAAQRSTEEVRLVVKTPSGTKLIEVEKLLITAPPLVENR